MKKTLSGSLAVLALMATSAAFADTDPLTTKSYVDAGLRYVHNEIEGKADAANVYTKTQVDNALAAKANSADVYTKTEVDSAIQNASPTYTAGTGIAINGNVISVTTVDTWDPSVLEETQTTP